MRDLIGDWVGKKVYVTLRAMGFLHLLAGRNVVLEGKLLEANESGILLEIPKGKKGQTFVPSTAISHIDLVYS